MADFVDFTSYGNTKESTLKCFQTKMEAEDAVPFNICMRGSDGSAGCVLLAALTPIRDAHGVLLAADILGHEQSPAELCSTNVADLLALSWCLPTTPLVVTP